MFVLFYEHVRQSKGRSNGIIIGSKRSSKEFKRCFPPAVGGRIHSEWRSFLVSAPSGSLIIHIQLMNNSIRVFSRGLEINVNFIHNAPFASEKTCKLKLINRHTVWRCVLFSRFTIIIIPATLNKAEALKEPDRFVMLQEYVGLDLTSFLHSFSDFTFHVIYLFIHTDILQQ